jgi:energy-coupling factor transporter ATP-binding protein EcfA2
MSRYNELVITSIVLSGYNRITLNNRNSITIKPTKRLQLILGSNGCGKSSILSELDLMPPDASDFIEGGFKQTTCRKGGRTYILSSTKTNGGNAHSFKQGDEELNPGGTAAAQRILIKQEFGLTPEIAKMISGREEFTKMSPSRRREWFTMFSDVNYDFAIGVFNRAKEKLRDTTGAIKIQKKYLMDETNKLISEEMAAELTKSQAELNSLLTDLYSIYNPTAVRSVSSLPGLLNELDALNIKLGPVVIDLFINGTVSFDKDRISESINEHKSLYNRYLGLLEAYSKEHEDAVAKYDLYMQRDTETVESLTKRQGNIKERCSTIETTLKTSVEKFIGGGYAAAYHSFMQVAEELIGLFSSLPSNDDRRFSKQRIEELEVICREATAELNARDKRAAFLTLEIKHAEEQHRDGNVTCPECSFAWSLSDKATVIDGYKRQLAEISDEAVIVELNHRVEMAKAEIELNREYGEKFVAIQRAGKMLHARHFSDLWNSWFPPEKIYNEPKRLAILVSDISHDLELLAEDERLKAEYHEIGRLIEISKATDSFSIDELTANIKRLTNLIATCNVNIVASNEAMKSLKSALSKITMIEEASLKYERLFEACSDACADDVVSKLNQEIKRRIDATQIALSMVSEKLINADMQTGIVQSIKDKIEALEKEKILLDKIISNLSPTEGLIADGLGNFIKSFIARMNAFIRKVWTYPLVIKADFSGEIDYRFPLMVQHAGKGTKDVSEGSAGMQEIINLAFRVTGMKYLGMDSYPLQIDEFAKAMDDAHRTNATELIKLLMDQENFSQFFIVSHDHKQYGAFSNPEVCVVCSANVYLPEGLVVNEHVAFS